MFLLLVGWSWIHRPIIQADSQNQQSSSQALFPCWTYILESQGFKHSLTKVDEESRWREAAKEMETKVSITLHVLCLYLTIQIKTDTPTKRMNGPFLSAISGVRVSYWHSTADLVVFWQLLDWTWKMTVRRWHPIMSMNDFHENMVLWFFLLVTTTVLYNITVY